MTILLTLIHFKIVNTRLKNRKSVYLRCTKNPHEKFTSEMIALVQRTSF